jgi:hypothetical protein
MLPSFSDKYKSEYVLQLCVYSIHSQMDNDQHPVNNFKKKKKFLLCMKEEREEKFLLFMKRKKSYIVWSWALSICYCSICLRYKSSRRFRYVSSFPTVSLGMAYEVSLLNLTPAPIMCLIRCDLAYSVPLEGPSG